MSEIDILLSTYNGEKYLSGLIESLLKQTYSDWKLLIRDDGSSETTINIIKKYKEAFPNKIYFYEDSFTQLKPSASFSKLLEYSTANYIMFCDQDDIWFEDKIEKTLQMMESLEREFPNAPFLIHTDLKVVDEDLGLISESLWSYQKLNPNKNTLDHLLVQNVVTGCTIMINKRLKYLASPIHSHAVMHDWWISLVASLHSGIYHINEPTMLYRQHSNNDTGAKKYSLSYFFHQIGNVNNILTRVLEQGKAFKERYEYYITSEQNKQLKYFIKIGNSKGFSRDLNLFRFAIKKHGLLRKLGFIVIVLTYRNESFGNHDDRKNGIE